MNLLFISISELPHISQHSISLDLIHEFICHGHRVYAICAADENATTPCKVTNEADCTVLRVRIGKNKKANIIQKVITTVMLPRHYIKALKDNFDDVKFDLVLYPTPPVTQVKTVEYIKRCDGARSYLLLKDIFPQNAVDIGMMGTGGIRGLLYRYFRQTEKRLYAISDRIGCMSQANVDYILKHNPEVPPEKVEVCPNSIEFVDMRISADERIAVRNKYGIPLDKKVFVYGGNLGKPQGIPFIIDCLKTQEQSSDAFFLIVGDGTEYGKLESYFNEIQPHNMKLMKRLPKEDYDRMIAACDVGLVFLDHRFTIPNFPSRLLSYMQAGLPVLTCTDPNSDVGKVVVDGGFGWWCESNNAIVFKDIVDDVVYSDCRNAGNNAMSYLKKHYLSSMSYETIINNNHDEQDGKRLTNENCSF